MANKHIHNSSCSGGSCTTHSHNAKSCSCGESHSNPEQGTKSHEASSESSSCCCSKDSDDPDASHNESCETDDGCGCGHEHSHDMPTKKLDIILLIISAILFASALFVSFTPIKFILFLSSVLLAGYDLFITGFKMLLKFKFEENVLLLIAVVASFAIMEYPEASIVTILFKLGGIIESSAIRRSKKSMEKLMEIRPDYAVVMNEQNKLVQIDAKQIAVGDIVYVRTGDKVAVDSKIIDGHSSVDSSALTGESVPVDVVEGDKILSGSINISGLLKCEAISSFENSTASQIIDLVYNSSQKKGKTEGFISRLAKVYTPIVMVLALMIAIIPPLFNAGTYHEFIMRSLIFLVAACPCALVISIPLTFFSAIGAVSKQGVLVKGSTYIEKFAKIDAVALDKTGTITSGALSVDEIIPFGNYTKDELSPLFYSIEGYSTHPIAKAIVSSLEGVQKLDLINVKEQAGLGLTADYNNKPIVCGGKNLLIKNNISTDNLIYAAVYLAIDNIVVGAITLKEEIPQSSLVLTKQLESVGIKKVVMLTGDNKKSAQKVANKCNINEFYAGLLPKDKVAQVNKLKEKGHTVLFVGDGINDAPVLTTADLGVSMGFGSEVANVSSDVVLSSNSLKSLPSAIKLSKRGMSIVYFNITFALLIKALVLTLGAFGLASMWLAVFADIGVTILTVLNSIRLLRVKNNL